MAVKSETNPSTQEIDALLALFNSGNFADLEAGARKLTLRFPKHGFAWHAMGVAMLRQNRYPAAFMPLQQAAKLWPMDAQVHNNLASVFRKLGRLPEAEASFRHALKLSPTFAEAHLNLGHTLLELDRPAEAERSYRDALVHRPDYIKALNSLAISLITQGRRGEALKFTLQALQIKESWDSKHLVVQCLKEFRVTGATADLRAALVRALSEPWGSVADLTQASTDIIRLNPAISTCITSVMYVWPQRLLARDLFRNDDLAAIAEDAVLRALLDATPICDISLERFLTTVRHTMLEAAIEPMSEAPEKPALDFYAALARQCFINEYVFSWTDAESRKAHALRDALVVDLENDSQISSLNLVTVAAYFALYTLPSSEKLLQGTWPDAITSILKQQVNEPAEEKAIRNSIPKLTPIENELSLLVQNQYEENPYPRWVRAAPARTWSGINEFVQQCFPLSPFRPNQHTDQTDVLIAGCGTGYQSILMAQQFPQAQILAIDLSLTSLSYAKRKTQELGLKSITYAQADITEFTEDSKTFDVIECSGVLHHLADPLAGWNVLLSRLRNGGLMRLGLYSEVARRDIVRMQTMVKEQHIGSTPEEIRQFRQELMMPDNTTGSAVLFRSPDFFSISACRDALFHVQEHRTTLAGINAFIRKNQLQLLGFENKPGVLHAFRLRFPSDQSAANLSNWEAFEHENPDTFLGMYQFWVQKSHSTSPRV